MSNKNPHIAGRYTLIVALVGLIGTFGGILLTHYLNTKTDNEEVENVEPKNEEDKTLETELPTSNLITDENAKICEKQNFPRGYTHLLITPKELNVGACYIVRLSGGDDSRIMFRTRALTNLEIKSVNKEHGSVAKETEIANGLYQGQMVTYLGASGNYYKVKAYIREEQKLRIGYLAKTLYGTETLADLPEWPR